MVRRGGALTTIDKEYYCDYKILSLFVWQALNEGTFFCGECETKRLGIAA